MGNNAAVDRLDSPSDSKVVATASHDAGADAQVADLQGITRRSRTGDLLITKLASWTLAELG
jgi:hypothetical protein